MVIEAGRVAVGTTHIAAMNVAGSLVAFLFTVSIASLLTAVDVGLISLMLSMISIFNTLTL